MRGGEQVARGQSVAAVQIKATDLIRCRGMRHESVSRGASDELDRVTARRGIDHRVRHRDRQLLISIGDAASHEVYLTGDERRRRILSRVNAAVAQRYPIDSTQDAVRRVK